MFLRHKTRRKDGKEHRTWSIVENRRVAGGRTVQRHVLYLGEINDSQRAAWCQPSKRLRRAAGKLSRARCFPKIAPPRSWIATWCMCAQRLAAAPAPSTGRLLAGLAGMGSADAG